jgi:hypothetical protein
MNKKMKSFFHSRHRAASSPSCINHNKPKASSSKHAGMARQARKQPVIDSSLPFQNKTNREERGFSRCGAPFLACSSLQSGERERPARALDSQASAIMALQRRRRPVGRGGAASPLPTLLLALVLAAVAATAAAALSLGGFGTGNAFAPPSPSGRRRGQGGAFQSPWLPTPLRQQQRRQQQQQQQGRRAGLTVMNDGGKGGLLKNLQGLFRPGLTSKPAKAVRLPTTHELHQALAAPEPGQLMRLMEVRWCQFDLINRSKVNPCQPIRPCSRHSNRPKQTHTHT